MRTDSSGSRSWWIRGIEFIQRGRECALQHALLPGALDSIPAFGDRGEPLGHVTR